MAENLQLLSNMLLTAIWNVLSKKEPYSSAGYISVPVVPSQTVINTVISRSAAEDLLRSMGYVISEDNEDTHSKVSTVSTLLA